jgi:hypothetical protein
MMVVLILFLGIGKTNIRFPSPEQRTGKQNKYFVDNNNFFIGKNNQRSVNSDNKQVGGLKIDSEKLWTKSPQYLLPDFSVNSPQSSSFAQANDRQYNIVHLINKTLQVLQMVVNMKFIILY